MSLLVREQLEVQQELQLEPQGPRVLQALPPEAQGARVVQVVRVVRPRGQLVVQQVLGSGEQVVPLALALPAQEQGLPRVRALLREQRRHCHRQSGRERHRPRLFRLRRRGFLR